MPQIVKALVPEAGPFISALYAFVKLSGSMAVPIEVVNTIPDSRQRSKSE
jgi:hypothetical protein